MAIKGVDVAALRALVNSLTGSRNEIDSVVKQLTSELHGVHWVGPDRIRFDNEWNGHVAHLGNIVVALEAAASDALKHAIRQEAVSGGRS